MNGHHPASLKRLLSLLLVLILAIALMPIGAFAAREGETSITPVDADKDGKPESYKIDWDGDGVDDEQWDDPDEDGVIDNVQTLNTGGDDTRSPRGKAGMRVVPLQGGNGTAVFIDWDGDGHYEESWWDLDGDGTVEDTDIYQTESKVVDNTKATRFRGVFVGVKNGLKYPEKDVDDLTGALEGYGASWNSSDMTKLKGASATPNAIKAAIDAAKADSKPGDEFIFYFSGHGGGYDKDDGLSGGRIDTSGDETAIRIPESEFGEFDSSGLTTPAAGWIHYYGEDLDGDGKEDTRTVKKSDGSVEVWRLNASPPPEWIVAGKDTNGDGKVDKDDGGVDMNGDGDKNDSVGVDDVIYVANNTKVTDDQLTEWLSGFPESVTIVVILDSCYSGSFVPDLKNNLKDKDGKPLRPGHLEVITAAPADDVGYERPVSNGVLTQGILDALTCVSVSAPGDPVHDTTYADAIGNADDRTTTRELFTWACPSATTYTNLDNDGDGSRNEDSPIHASILPTATTAEDTMTGKPASVAEQGVTHLELDIDGDGLYGEDPEPMTESFFDVFYDPDFDDWPTPTFKQVFSGDTSLSVTGMMPGIGISTDVPLAPGTAITPGPTLELTVREVPTPEEPEPLPGFEFAGSVYDLTLEEIDFQIPDFDEATLTIPPVQGRSPATLTVPATISMYASPMIPPDSKICCYTEGIGWEELPTVPFPIDDETVRFDAITNHFSQFALMVLPGLGRSADTTPPADPTGLDAVASGDDVSLTWHNPTDPDHAGTKLVRSASDYATTPTETAGQTTVVDTRTPFAEDPDLSDGIYYYTAFAYDHAGNWSGAAKDWVKVGETTSMKIEGPTRYQTAVQASKKAFPTDGSLPVDPEGYKSVVVATGLNWPDALGGSALAGAVGGPILLVGTTVPTDVAAEIQRLGADRVLLLGGTGAVSAAVETALGEISGVKKVERIYGADRYATAEAVAERTVEILPSFDGTAIVATGMTFPDALAGSPLAAYKGWPIYLSTSTGLRASTKAQMQADGVTDAIIMGGTGAVPASVETELNALLSGDVDRLSGADRYATAVAVDDYAVASAGMRWDGAAVTTGQNFPDALAGGVLQGFDRSVILLTRSTSLPTCTKNALETNAYRIGEVRFLGGTGAVDESVRTAVMDALK